MAEFVHGRAVPVPVLGADGTTTVSHLYLAGDAPDVDEAITFAKKFRFGKVVQCVGTVYFACTALRAHSLN